MLSFTATTKPPRHRAQGFSADSRSLLEACQIISGIMNGISRWYKPLLANRTAPEIEAAIIALSLEQPAFGQIRVANEMRDAH